MKKIIVYISIVIAGISLNGCFDLDTYPGSSMSQSIFWQTEAHAREGLMGIYALLRNNNCYGEQYWYNDVYGCISNSFSNQAVNNGTYTSRDSYVQDKWQYMYEGVQRTNSVIRNVSGMSLDESAQTELIAEAKFLRALFYFNLLDFFGGVPYYDETTEVNAEYADMKKPGSTAEEIRSHILSDLNAAVSGLRAAWPNADYGRATKGAAYAQRGKVYLYNKEWKNAIADFEEVVYNKSDNYGYALDADYARIFKLYNGAKSTEMIFSVQNKGGPDAYGMMFNTRYGNRGSFGPGGGALYPSPELIDMYEKPDGSPFDWEEIFPGYNTTPVENGQREAKRQDCLCVEMDNGVIVGMRNADTAKILNAYRNRDSRLMATAIVPYSNYVGWVNNAPKNLMIALDGYKQGILNSGTLYWDAGNIHNCFYRKFVAEGNLDGALTNRDHTPFEFPVIRYADVLMMLAEAYNEDGQLDKAVIELNRVRARESVNLPGLNSGAAWLAVTTKEQMAERIRKERAVELAGEGLRFSDLRRWGFEVAYGETAGKGYAKNIYGENLYARQFTKRDLLWPVPAVEIERNPALENQQNPDW
ncbi:MAG: RagB/SusD family nutrient uptake outer membrane protein [Bacteroidales bacterium]|jgi:tetratricopeptide (TPR) repeat protein|nr:RagB/SusD family nutrient uptake outer membrane protein [Bacteroidales bacterium]